MCLAVDSTPRNKNYINLNLNFGRMEVEPITSDTYYLGKID